MRLVVFAHKAVFTNNFTLHGIAGLGKSFIEERVKRIECDVLAAQNPKFVCRTGAINQNVNHGTVNRVAKFGNVISANLIFRSGLDEAFVEIIDLALRPGTGDDL